MKAKIKNLTHNEIACLSIISNDIYGKCLDLKYIITNSHAQEELEAIKKSSVKKLSHLNSSEILSLLMPSQSFINRKNKEHTISREEFDTALTVLLGMFNSNDEDEASDNADALIKKLDTIADTSGAIKNSIRQEMYVKDKSVSK